MIEVSEHFSIVDEGDGWIVVDKSAPLIVHPANNKGLEPTLLGGVQKLLSFEIECGAVLSIINRLDRETSGLVLIATHKSKAREFSKAMERRQVKKLYQAIVFGWPSWDEVSLDEPILRKGEVEDSLIWVKQMVHPKGRSSRTNFKVKERRLYQGRRISVLDVEPVTGRMHQIRVHAAHLGFPLVGDKIYGDNEEYLRFIKDGFNEGMLDRLLLKRHALHACGLSLVIGEQLQSWEVDLERDLKYFLAGSDVVDEC